MRHIDIDTGLKHRYLKLWHVAQREERAFSAHQYAPVPAASEQGERGKRGEREGKKKRVR